MITTTMSEAVRMAGLENITLAWYPSPLPLEEQFKQFKLLPLNRWGLPEGENPQALEVAFAPRPRGDGYFVVGFFPFYLLHGSAPVRYDHDRRYILYSGPSFAYGRGTTPEEPMVYSAHPFLTLSPEVEATLVAISGSGLVNLLGIIWVKPAKRLISRWAYPRIQDSGVYTHYNHNNDLASSLTVYPDGKFRLRLMRENIELVGSPHHGGSNYVYCPDHRRSYPPYIVEAIAKLHSGWWDAPTERFGPWSYQIKHQAKRRSK
jgi:hypothetical protein